MAHTKDINIQVNLDDKKIPEKIMWSATDGPKDDPLSCAALIMALWDSNKKNSLRLDLWTKEMPVDEMKQFYYETFMTLADSFERATGEKERSKEIRDFATDLAGKMALGNK